ncbi:uncharacterized protein LTR77_003728 [Saxophila tyrrhenica]|uniref:Oxidoreductase NAD-binding domain-containing protein 1 n=1 Tax=Saxophila tyrrhenica TaxID=1690608 RepID=A0AAV9PF39_9PEZI|nr:hypothetical protein LTR77_003728 [Saxophila tyrrhenica]
MATVRSSLPHEDRTAAEPRESNLEPVLLSNIRQVNDTIRLLRLTSVDPTLKFLPGQWLDTFIPGLPKAGGFTITSTPSEARPSGGHPGHIELAVQKSTNPPAQWLWQPSEAIMGKQIVVRVGGSFTWPPPQLDTGRINRLVLIAGGVGINPLISIFGQLIRSASRPKEIHFIYGTKAESELDPQRILFLSRLTDLIAAADDRNVTLRLFLTGTGDEGRIEHGRLPNKTYAGRITQSELVRAIDGYADDKAGRSNTLCYVCGVPRMTDESVEFISRQDGMAKERVLCEKWW